MPQNKSIVISALLFTGLGIVLGVVIFTANNLMTTDDLQRNRIARGEVIYNQHCASCHGKNLEGQPNWKTRNAQGRLPAPPHDETGHTWHHDDQLLFELTKFGMVPPNIPEGYESDMPGFEKILTDDEIRDVLQFIKSRWPEEIRIRQEAMSSGKSGFVKP